MKRVHAFTAILLAIGLPSASCASVVCTLVSDVLTGNTLIEEGDCNSRVIPASTFKLA